MKMTIINQILKTQNLWLSKIFPRPFERFAVKGNNLIGVEIGVEVGKHAMSLLKTLDIKKLYLIDPYISYKDFKEEIIDNVESNKYKALNRLKDYGNLKWVFKTSDNASIDIPNELDFVYIDGCHKYEFVKNDIKNYYPKLKIGGVLGGHDMFNGFSEVHDGVIKAVIEFAVDNDLKLYIEDQDWWIIK